MNGSGRWLLALHSSSDRLGLGLQPLSEPVPGDGPAEPLIATFPLGRRLSNELLTCVEQLLPAARWRELGRLAVATGPGGFTGTRITVVFARTLAQQLGLPLDGFSSFLLIARRLRRRGEVGAERFWLVQDLPRRGVVAGCYGADTEAPGGLAEWQAPRLFRSAAELPAGPRREARVDPVDDVGELLALAQLAHGTGVAAPWQPVLPLYPTSPVERT